MAKLAFLFAGQGSQTPGMGKDLYENEPQSRAVFDLADQTLTRSITKLCFEGSKEDLAQTQNTQPCVLTVTIAAYEALISRGIMPDAVAGFSLGEYAALVAAGVYTFTQAIELVTLRARAMHEAVPEGKGGMIAVLNADEQIVLDLCAAVQSGYCAPANYNCKGQIVVAGETDALKELSALLKEAGLRGVPLAVSGPFHSEMMRPAANALALELPRFTPKEPQIPVILNSCARPLIGTEELGQRLCEQVMSPVLWEKSIQALLDAGIDTFIEVGPGKTLSGFMKKIAPDVRMFQVGNLQTLEETVNAL